MDRKAFWSFGALCTVPFVMVLGNSMLIPVLPQIKSALQLTQVEVALLLTAFSLPAGITIPFSGVLSDMVGRKKVMVPALLIYGFAGVLAGFAALSLDSEGHAYAVLIGARIVQGIGAGGTYQLAMALAGDMFPQEQRSRALGVLEAANGIGKVASPLLGASLATISWQAPFFLYGALAVPAAFLVGILVKEKRGKSLGENSRTAGMGAKTLKKYKEELKGVISNKATSYAVSYLAGFTCLFILFGSLADLTDVLESRHDIGGIGRGLIISFPVSFMALSSYFSGVFLTKKPAKTLSVMVWGGLALMAVSLAINTAFSAKEPWWPEVALITVSGAAVGLVLPSLNTLIASSAPTAQRGLMTCLYGTVRFFGAALGPAVFGILLGLGRSVMWGAAAVLCGGACILVLSFMNAQMLMGPSE
jgi:ACDE family multidrug resistance protein